MNYILDVMTFVTQFGIGKLPVFKWSIVVLLYFLKQLFYTISKSDHGRIRNRVGRGRGVLYWARLENLAQ